MIYTKLVFCFPFVINQDYQSHSLDNVYTYGTKLYIFLESGEIETLKKAVDYILSNNLFEIERGTISIEPMLISTFKEYYQTYPTEDLVNILRNTKILLRGQNMVLSKSMIKLLVG